MRIPKYFQVNRKQFLYMLFWQLGFFALGVVMVLLINTFLNEDMDYACIGTLTSLFGIIASGAMQMNSIYFRVTVLMGQTRRYFLTWCPPLTALLVLQGWLTSFCLFRLENALYRALYPGFENGLSLGIVFKWWIVALSVVIVSILALFLGAMHVKFGAKIMLIVWCTFCFSFSLLPQAVDRYQSGGTSLMARIGGVLLAVVELLTPAMWIAVGAAAALAALAFSVWVYLNAEVRM